MGKRFQIGEQMSWIITSYFTEGFYEKVAEEHLIRSCRRLGLPHYIVKVKSKGDWIQNTNIKAVFVRDMMRKFPDRDIVFLDVDAEVKEYPSLFDQIEGYDMACHYLDFGRWYNVREKMGVKELLSGTLLFKHTPKAEEVISAWISGLGRIWEQKVLQSVVESLKPRVYELPLEYCYISSLPNGQEPYIKVERPVIVHHQKSREIRRRGKKHGI